MMHRFRRLNGALLLLMACTKATPDPVQPTAATTGAESIPTHDTLMIPSRALGETRLINVHTPAAYDAGETVHFQVLYMPDGGLDEDFPHVVHMVDSLIAVGVIRPAIVVGVPNTQRRRDLTGPTRIKSDSAIAPRVGGSRAFRQFLADELIPAIDHRYRTTSERAIIGESLAGLFVVETFLAQPKLFSHYVAFDPSVWWNGGAMIDTAGRAMARFDPSPRTLYLAVSHEPTTAVGSARLDSLLHAAAPRGLRWSFTPRADLEHATIFRALERAGLTDALR